MAPDENNGTGNSGGAPQQPKVDGGDGANPSGSVQPPVAPVAQIPPAQTAPPMAASQVLSAPSSAVTVAPTPHTGPISPLSQNLNAGPTPSSAISDPLSLADKVMLVISIVILFGAALIALAMKLSGASSDLAFATNAVGLILAQGFAGMVSSPRLKCFPVVATLASLFILWASYHVPST